MVRGLPTPTLPAQPSTIIPCAVTRHMTCGRCMKAAPQPTVITAVRVLPDSCVPSMTCGDVT